MQVIAISKGVAKRRRQRRRIRRKNHYVKMYPSWLDSARHSVLQLILFLNYIMYVLLLCLKAIIRKKKKRRWTLNAHISEIAWRIQLKFGIEGAFSPPLSSSRRSLHGKIREFLFWECQARYAWNRISLLL